MSDNIEKSLHKLRPVFERLRVLVVEDNPVDREVLKAHLETLGIQHIHEAADGIEAIFKIGNADKISNPFHLVITDWKMPKKDGMAVVEFLMARPVAKRPLTVMLTSVADELHVRTAVGSGVNDYILKPIDSQILKQKILTLVTQMKTLRAG